MHLPGEVTVKRLVLPVVLAGVLAGCADTPATTRTPTTLAGAPTVGSPVANPADQGRPLPIDYVAQTAAGPRLQREFHRLAAVDPASEAVRAMLAQPTGTDPDYHNPWPAGTTLRAPVTSTPGTITVDLSSAPPADPLATQQLVFTVHGELGVTTPVRLLHDGVPVGWCARGSPRPRKARCSRPSGSRWSFRRVGTRCGSARTTLPTGLGVRCSPTTEVS
jgi:hypothetical protein